MRLIKSEACWHHKFVSNNNLKPKVCTWLQNRPLMIDKRGWRCPKTCTTAVSSVTNGATCTQCLPLFTCTPTYPLTRAYSVHPGPCNGNPRPTSSTSVSSSCCIFLWQLHMFHGAPPCHGYGITASLEFLVFVLLMQDFHTCSVSLFFVY